MVYGEDQFFDATETDHFVTVVDCTLQFECCQIDYIRPRQADGAAIVDSEHHLPYSSAAEAAVDFPVAFTPLNSAHCARSRACTAGLPVFS